MNSRSSLYFSRLAGNLMENRSQRTACSADQAWQTSYRIRDFAVALSKSSQSPECSKDQGRDIRRLEKWGQRLCAAIGSHQSDCGNRAGIQRLAGIGINCGGRPAALACKFVSRRDESATVRWIEGTVAAIGCNDELGLGPRTMKRPGTLHGTDDIVTTLHDHSRNLAN